MWMSKVVPYEPIMPIHQLFTLRDLLTSMGRSETGRGVGLCLLIINFPPDEMSESYFVPYQPNEKNS
jgi:hypothetical protein